jgi:hypothetical protein
MFSPTRQVRKSFLNIFQTLWPLPPTEMPGGPPAVIDRQRRQSGENRELIDAAGQKRIRGGKEVCLGSLRASKADRAVRDDRSRPAGLV